MILARLLILGAALLLSGCIHLNRDVPFQYEPAAISQVQPIPKSAGFRILMDDRPRRDRIHTRSVVDLPEKVTEKLTADFRRLRIFKEVRFPATGQEDVIVTGTIKRFSWGAYENPLWYVPLVSLMKATGVPLGVAGGVVEIRLEAKDAKTGANLGVLSASSHVRNQFNGYDVTLESGGMELGDSFRAAEAKLGAALAAACR